MQRLVDNSRTQEMEEELCGLVLQSQIRKSQTAPQCKQVRLDEGLP